VLRGWAEVAGAVALREIDLLVDGDQTVRTGCWMSAGGDSQSESYKGTVRTVLADLAHEVWMEAAA
jgi:hypothetical protein